jgi:hypothetical protein
LAFSFFGKSQKSHHPVHGHEALELGSQLIVKWTEVKIGFRQHSLTDGAQTGFEIKKRPFA